MADFNSKYTGEQVEALLDIVSQGGSGGGEGGEVEKTTEAEITAMGFTKNLGTITEVKMNGVSKGTSGVVDLGNVLTEHQDISGKQDTISDLATIREGASKGATALQSVPTEYVTETELNNKGYATISALEDKVDKVTGKQLSTEDFTTALKTKLEGLSNYNDAEISTAVSSLQTQLDTLVSGNANDAINSFNEIIAFLDGVKDTQDLAGIIASIETQIAAKQATISDLDTIRAGAALGATALQSETYKGTVTGVKINNTTKNPSNGVVDLGTVITAHQDISGKADKSSLATVATSGSYNDLSNKPTIPSAVTESTVSGWGFTKNTGTYSKPSGGIPKSDLATTVQTSLGKADTAIQYTSFDQLDYLVTANGFESKQGGTIYALPDMSNGDEDDIIATANTLKTINGTSILGSGNIEISGGEGGGTSSDGKKEVIWWDMSSGETITSMRPNVIYWIIELNNITIDSFEDAASEVESYDLFTAILDLGSAGNSAISLTLPDYVLWANGTIPEVDNDGHTRYELSISRLSDGYDSIYHAILTPFKSLE